MSNKIFVGQSNLRFYFNVGISLTGMKSAQLKIQVPGSSTVIVKTAEVQDISTGKLYYDFQSPSLFTVAGQYKFWLVLTFNDDRVSISSVYTEKIYTEGEV